MGDQKKQIFTVFIKGSKGAFISNYNKRDINTIEDTIEDAVAYGFKPEAWAAEGVANYGGTKTNQQLYRESIEAGRLIELVDGKYVAMGGPTTLGELLRRKLEGMSKEKPKEESEITPFRIGGIYRTQGGQLIKLTTPVGKDLAKGKYVSIEFNGMTAGTRQLRDGICVSKASWPNHRTHLVPGEVNEKGEPIHAAQVTEPQKEPEKSRMDTVREELVAWGVDIIGLSDSTLEMIHRDGQPKTIVKRVRHPAKPSKEVKQPLPTYPGLMLGSRW